MIDDLIEPSDVEQAEWPQATEAYVRGMENRIGELEAENKTLRSIVDCVIADTGDDPEIMAASRAEWAARALEAEAKLAKAVEISKKAIEQLRSYGQK